jgi:DNA-binding NtrC family response regulator
MLPIPRKIFVTEDNRTEGMLLQLALSEIEGLEVRVFPNAKSLLAAPATPDIVIVDLNLPDMSGLELIQLLRERDPDLRMVAVSAQRDIDVVAKVQALGVYNYLVKSEGCLPYLRHVIEELIIVLNYREQQQSSSRQ